MKKKNLKTVNDHFTQIVYKQVQTIMRTCNLGEVSF